MDILDVADKVKEYYTTTLKARVMIEADTFILTDGDRFAPIDKGAVDQITPSNGTWLFKCTSKKGNILITLI